MIVGSANVDMIVRSDKLPVPGETIVGGVFSSAGGGKGANQAIAARRLGAEVTFVVRLGDDPLGHGVRESLAAEGLPLRWVTMDSQAPTGVALILVDRTGQNMISVASGANLRLAPDDVQRAAPMMAAAAVLVTQLEIPLATVRAALALARAHGVTTLLNPAPAQPLTDDLLALVDWLTPNELEAAALAGRAVTDLASALEAAQGLRRRGPRNVVVTLGSLGAVWAGPSGALLVAPFPVTVVDTTAAGDAFTAALAVGLARGETPAAALTYASAAGALTTTRAGAQPSLPTDAEVRALRSTRRDAAAGLGRA